MGPFFWKDNMFMATTFDLVQLVCVYVCVCVYLLIQLYISIGQLIWFSPHPLNINLDQCIHNHPFDYMSIDMIFGRPYYLLYLVDN